MSAGRAPSAATASAIALAAVAMPLAYGLAAFHGAWKPFFNPPVFAHAGLNTLANVALMLSATRLGGRLDQRLSGVFARSLGAHGVLALIILVSRNYYSIPMLLTGVPASVLLGGAVVLIRQRATRPRVGVLGPWTSELEAPALGCEPITDPAASIRPYDLLLVAFPGEPPPDLAAVVSRALLAGKRVRHVTDYLEEVHGVVAIAHFDLDHLPEGGLTSYRSAKRLIDIAASVVLLPLALPVILLAALGVAITSGRPAFFAQARLGQGGRVFNILKIRTMRAAPRAGPHIATAVKDDRITPYGRWLRRSHIDELPQLWNVLVGEMSLVGPRPEQPALAETYAREEPAFAYRQLVRPGITGWAQVRAGYAADLAETRVKLAYDLFYLKNFSLGLDVQICLRTVWTLLSGGGSR